MDKENKEKYVFSSATPLTVVSDEITELRRQQSCKLKGELLTYGVILRDLIATDISYSKKNELLNIALYIINDIELYELFLYKKNLPIRKLCNEFIKPRRFVEDYRDFIITYVILLSSDDYKYIKDYIMIEENSGNVTDIAEAIKKDNKIVKGIVLATRGKVAKIITSDGEFKSITVKEKVSTGDIVTGSLRKRLKDYKLFGAILISLTMILIMGLLNNYFNVKSTVMVKTTSPIMIELNTYKKVKSIKSDTSKGKELIESINVLDRSFDTALLEIIKYAEQNEMIPNAGIIITVNGDTIIQSDVEKSEEYVFMKRLDVRVNNSGFEYKLQ